MTGLDLEHDALVEIAVLVTDDELNVLGEGVDVVIRPPDAAARAHARRRPGDAHDVRPARRAGRRHHARGRRGPGARLRPRVRPRRRARRRWPATRSPPTAASSRATCPRSTPTCTTGSSTSARSRSWPAGGIPRVYFNAPTKHGGHRALADILESIEELKYYRDAVFVPLPGPDTDAAAAHRGDVPGRGGTRTPRPARPAEPGNGFLTEPRTSRTLDPCRAAVHAVGRGHGGCSSAGRAPGCGPGGRGFKSRHSPQYPQVRVGSKAAYPEPHWTWSSSPPQDGGPRSPDLQLARSGPRGPAAARRRLRAARHAPPGHGMSAVTGKATRVLIADDQALVRRGFRLILEIEPDLDVVGEASRRSGGRGRCP